MTVAMSIGDGALAGAAAASPMLVWNGDQEPLVCRAVREEADDVKTFLFTAREPRVFHFAPGQFLTLELTIGGQTAARCYSIVTAPSEPFAVAVSVKRVPGGLVSNYLHDSLRIGDEVRARGPQGRFSVEVRGASKLLLLSAGIGITPMLSIARSLVDAASGRDVVFVHCARSVRQRLFAEELRAIERQLPCFRLLTFLSRDEGPPEPGLRYRRLTAHDMFAEVPDIRERDVLCCGPDPFMRLVRTALEGAGHPMERYQQESFRLEHDGEAGPPLEPIARTMTPSFRITFARQGQTVTCEGGQTILQAARRARIAVPSSCAQGLCGTCKTGNVKKFVSAGRGS
jgi:ferredoxin-NADP reductase